MKDPNVKEEKVKAPPTTPWKPSSILTVNRKSDGFRYRWVRKDLLDKKIAEGWEPVNATSPDRVEAPESTLIDGKPLTTYVTKRGLVLCRLPEEMGKARDAYYRNLSDNSLKASVKEFEGKTDMGDGKPLAYGEIKLGR